MRKTLPLALALSAFFVVGCSAPKNDSPLTGTWVEPVPGLSDMEQGFTLHSDGTAESVNMATLTTERWKTDGDRLVLEGKSIGNGVTSDYREEWKVLEVGKQLKLQHPNGMVRTLERKAESKN